MGQGSGSSIVGYDVRHSLKALKDAQGELKLAIEAKEEQDAKDREAEKKLEEYAIFLFTYLHQDREVAAALQPIFNINNKLLVKLNFTLPQCDNTIGPDSNRLLTLCLLKNDTIWRLERQQCERPDIIRPETAFQLFKYCVSFLEGSSAPGITEKAYNLFKDWFNKELTLELDKATQQARSEIKKLGLRDKDTPTPPDPTVST
jgi:hypothetical protein